MNATPKPPSRPRRSIKTSQRPRNRVLPRRAVLIIIVLTVFIAAFTLDTEAVARLFWAGLAGHLGLPARIGACGVLLLLVAATIVTFYRPAPAPPPAKRRGKSAQPKARPKKRDEPIDDIAPAVPADPPAADAAPAVRRRGKMASAPAADRP